MDLLVYPCTGIEDGDKTFGDVTSIKCMIVPKETVVVTRDGKEKVSNTCIYIDGADVGKIKDTDEIEHYLLGRYPIQKINLYPSLFRDIIELIEVIL